MLQFRSMDMDKDKEDGIWIMMMEPKLEMFNRKSSHSMLWMRPKLEDNQVEIADPGKILE